MTSGITNDLRGVWGSSGSDVFAVGPDGTIRHYNGTSWSPMTSGITQLLLDVWGSSGSDVFAVGENGTILHYAPEAPPVTELPDLTITRVWQDGNRIRYTLRNDGDGPAGPPWYNSLFIDGNQMVEDLLSTVLPAGEQYDLVFSYEWQMTPGQHTIKVCADSRGDITESNEDNNCLEQVWGAEENLPDLTITRVWQEGDQIYYTLRNDGDAPTSSNFYNSLSIDGNPVAEDAITWLAPGTEINRVFDSVVQWATGEEHTIKVCADSRGDITESNEDNNCLEQVWGTGENLPNLTITGVWQEGDQIWYTIKNIGTGVIGPIMNGVSFYNTLSIDGNQVAEDHITTPLAPGQQLDRYFSPQWPAITGQYHVRVCADFGGNITESNEQNNRLERYIGVTTPPQITEEHPRWDINEDGTVNYLDLAILGAHYGELTESPYPRYDIDLDGQVRLDDCDILVAHYGEEVRIETTE